MKNDLGIALYCDFIIRAATTKEYVPESDGVPAHFVFSDGVGRNDLENTAVGFNIFLAPGKSQREYGTCDADSPARLVPSIKFSSSVKHFISVAARAARLFQLPSYAKGHF